MKTALMTLLALTAFAANSVLCRLALGDQSIDAGSFTIIRLLSGMLILLFILKLTVPTEVVSATGSWSGSIMLFVYAITFSYAYISLDTATGALILFSVVQITMIMASLLSGKRLHMSEWLGVAIAFVGFVYLILPGLTTPSVTGFMLMSLSGVAWAIYTLKGRHSENPLADTAYNFVRTLPFIVIVLLVSFQYAQLSLSGVLLAALSGAIASGVGYTIWYIALGGLSATQAGVLQLLVPVIAAIGGVIFVSEPISLRMTLAAVLILGGILLVMIKPGQAKLSVNVK